LYNARGDDLRHEGVVVGGAREKIIRIFFEGEKIAALA
jgi:hypothetical protein